MPETFGLYEIQREEAETREGTGTHSTWGIGTVAVPWNVSICEEDCEKWPHIREAGTGMMLTQRTKEEMVARRWFPV